MSGSTAARLLDVRVPGGQVTEAGVRGNVSVALQYLAAWLGGSGAVAINNLMEDTATAEIARSQLWQWIRHRAAPTTGSPVTLSGAARCWRRRLRGCARRSRSGAAGARRRSCWIS